MRKQGRSRPSGCDSRAVRIRTEGQPGFCAILSDLVAESSEGFTLKATDYQKGLKIRVHAARISAVDEKLRTWKSIQRITGEDYGPMPPDFGTPGWAKKQRDARK